MEVWGEMTEEANAILQWGRYGLSAERFNIIRPVRVQISVGCFVARKLAEPFLERKANEATYVCHAPFTVMGYGYQCVSQR